MKISKDGQVFFDPIQHKYTNVKGERLISCTTLIHKFVNEFDPDGSITKNYAKKHGMTVEEVLALWKAVNEESCTYGTSVHNELEHFILTGEIRESEYRWAVEEFAKISFFGKLHAEVLVHNIDEMVAGQVDLIEFFPDKSISIYDFKTNKKLEKTSYFKKSMLDCLWRFEDVNFNHYQLQLSLYAYLCELKGLKINKLTILYINPKSKLIEHHPVKYLKKDIINILKKKKDFVY